MVQPEWDQAKHILQSVEERAGTILGITTGDRAARHIRTDIRYPYRKRGTAYLTAVRHRSGYTDRTGA